MSKWQQELQNSIRSADQLFEVVHFEIDEKPEIRAILDRSPLCVTPYYLSLIDFSDVNDPIRKMALPSLSETNMSGALDTSGEHDNTVVTGLQHKYRETALMLTNNLCAMYCRHCFRKRLVGLVDEDSIRDLEAARNYIMQHTEITNALISGGDALLNSNSRLDEILTMLSDIPHLDLIRIATRTPVTLPSRITDDSELISILDKHNKKKKLFMVTQFNHPREVTDEAVAAVQAVLSLGIPVRNQTVLLKGVNDQAEVLGALLRKLTSFGIEPYYVFQCRPVSGVKSQFQIPLKEGIKIVEGAKSMQNGLGKSFRYCMSTVKGKIEIVAPFEDSKMVFKYHEAKDLADQGKLFIEEVANDQAWLDL